MFPQIFGKYVLDRELASGGMARVYEATLRGAGGFEKRLVVKQIRPELASDSAFVERFVEEAKTAVELSHPNIVPVYELGVEQGVYYIAMEYCEGATLAEILRETGPLSPDEGAYVGVEICRGLDFAHRRAGVIHRDVTPRNVLVDDEGAVRLIDFGIAAPADPDGDGESVGDVLGSPGHMAPEQYERTNLTAACDVFAVGTLLIEAWTGRPPFRRSTVAESRAALETSPPSIAEHDPQLEPLGELVATAVELDPKERPESAEQLARPLREFLRGSDAGDVARRLGARAHRARDRADSNQAWGNETISGDPEDGDRQSTETRTFAAREDVSVWTRPLPKDTPSSGPGEGSGPATRKISSVAPPEASRAASLGEAEVDGPSRGRFARPLALLATIGVLAFGVSKMGGKAPTAPIDAPSATVATAKASSEPSMPPSAYAEQATSSARPSAAPPATAAPRASVPIPNVVADAGVVAATEKGTLTVTAAPASQVSVAGQTFGSTPQTLQLKPGSYTVVFTFLGERLSAGTRVKPGERRTVHADFTSEPPKASVR